MNNLKILRKRKGVSQNEIADYLGVTRSAYGMYEQGIRNLNPESLSKLSDYFEVSIDTILGREPINNDFGRRLVEIPAVKAEDEVLIPLVASLRCGPGDAAEPFTYIKPVPIPASYVRRWGEGLQAIIAVGESMSPTIVPGDLLICKPGEAWTSGNVVSVNVEDCDMIKRIYETKDGGIDLRSDNPAFETLHYTEADIKSQRVHVLGRVLIPIGREL